MSEKQEGQGFSVSRNEKMKLSDLKQGQRFRFKPNQRIYEQPNRKVSTYVEYDTSGISASVYSVTKKFDKSVQCEAGVVKYNFKMYVQIGSREVETDCEIEIIE